MNFLAGLNQASSYVFAFVVMLGVLIFVHELGHFLAAKACGIRVLKFSLGFGSPIGFGRFRMRWVRGYTEYVVSWIPLGGFVKMLGENPGDEESPDARANPSEAMNTKPMWQKLVVVFAGPAMNLLLPVLIFSGILAVGLPQADAVIGEVEPGSPAAASGLQPGDRITAIDGVPVGWWRQVDEELNSRNTGELSVRYERDDVEATARVAIEPRQRQDVFGDVSSVGWVGLDHWRTRAMLGLTDRQSHAYRAGLRSGDLATAVNGAPVEDWLGFAQAYRDAGAGEVQLEIQRELDSDERVNVTVPALGDVAALGVIRANVFISKVTEDSPAERAGLLSGDLILSVDGVPMHSFETFAQVVRASEGRDLELVVARDGELIELAVVPILAQVDVPGLEVTVPRYRMGVMGNNLLAVSGSIGFEQVLNPLVAVPRALGLTVDITRVFLKGLGKLITGEVSRDQIAGPIGIAEIAGKALERGWLDYLQTLILISINLGILNLLPIPILDGGQAVVFLVEGIRRAPLSLRTREFVQQIGVAVLLMLMGFAFWNDMSRIVTRNWDRVVGWLNG